MNKIAEAIEALKNGEIIILVDDEERENEGDFVVLGQFATPDNINFMATHGRGLICTPITAILADKLRLPHMVGDNTDSHQTAFTVSIDHHTVTTGISAFERSYTIQSLLDEISVAEDYRRPGHVFPLIAVEGGVRVRRGHTEASIEFAKLCNSPLVTVICEIMNDDGSMARLPELYTLANKHKLKLVSIEQLVNYVDQILK